jgi:hypothetical protein
MGDLCPLARRRAKELGRIVRSDIESVATAKVTAAAGTITGTTAGPIGNGATPASTGAWHAAAGEESGPDPLAPVTVVELSRARRLTTTGWWSRRAPCRRSCSSPRWT